MMEFNKYAGLFRGRLLWTYDTNYGDLENFVSIISFNPKYNKRWIMHLWKDMN